MKLCFFGSEPEHKRIMDLLKTIPKYSDYVRQCDAFPDYAPQHPGGLVFQ